MPAQKEKRTTKASAKKGGASIALAVVPEKKKIGRPKGSGDTYDPEKAEIILRLIADGMSPDLAAKSEGFRSHWTLHSWRAHHPDFDKGYARAREQSADARVQEIISISDDIKTATDPVTVQAARVRIDTLKWIASKMQPRTYGDRLNLDGELNVNVTLAGALDALKAGG